MFTGLIEETGVLLALERSASGARLLLRAPVISREIRIGDSLAVNGCCLTLAAIESEALAFDLLRETLDRTNLGALPVGASVNLERALAVGARLGGHFVQGHIDTAAEVLAFEKAGADHRLEVALPADFARYLVRKGSVAIDGISLTVAEAGSAAFLVWIIPHTFAVTNLRDKRAGDLVNLEFDLLAKYVERLILPRHP